MSKRWLISATRKCHYMSYDSSTFSQNTVRNSKYPECRCWLKRNNFGAILEQFIRPDGRSSQHRSISMTTRRFKCRVFVARSDCDNRFRRSHPGIQRQKCTVRTYRWMMEHISLQILLEENALLTWLPRTIPKHRCRFL